MQKRGFTVIELVVAIAIILVLATVSMLAWGRYRQRARLSRVGTELSSIAGAVIQYTEDNNYQYPPDAGRGMAPGLEPYLTGGVWPEGPWPYGAYDWDNWLHPDTSQQIYQVTYRLCGPTDPDEFCSDPVLFPNFIRNSGIYHCISGPCIPHRSTPTVPGYCVNCTPKEQNY